MGAQFFKKHTSRFILINIFSMILLIFINMTLLTTGELFGNATFLSLSSKLLVSNFIVIIISVVLNILNKNSLLKAIAAENKKLSNAPACTSGQLTKLLENIDLAKTGEAPRNISDLPEELEAINNKLSEASITIADNYSTIANTIDLVANGEFSLAKSSLSIENENINHSLTNLLNQVIFANKFIATKASDIAKDNFVFSSSDEAKLKGDWKNIYTNLESIQSTFKDSMDDVLKILADLNKGILDTSDLNNEDTTGFKKECLILVRETEQYIIDIVRVLKEIERGNLSVKTSIHYKGKLSLIETGLNNVIGAFTNIIADIISTATIVTDQAGLVSNSSKLLEQDTKDQKQELVSLVNTITHISEITKETTANMQNSKQLAQSTSQKATSCNTKMDEMLVSMNDINDASKNISDIIKVIDEIAFQTNLLALNAAVESARAGVHGKGFAVVAEEVRNLAQRSQTAAKETTSLIEATVMKVNDGSKIANETADELKEMVKDVSLITSVIDTVDKTTVEQAGMIVEFKNKVISIDDRNKRTETTAYTSLGATTTLFENADTLRNKVSSFTLAKENINLNKKPNIETKKPETNVEIKEEKKVETQTKKSTSITQASNIKSSVSQKTSKIELKATSDKPASTSQKTEPAKPKFSSTTSKTKDTEKTEKSVAKPTVNKDKPKESFAKTTQTKAKTSEKPFTKSSTLKAKDTEKPVSKSSTSTSEKLTAKTESATRTRLNTSKDDILVKRKEVVKPKSDFGLANTSINDSSDKKIPNDDEIERIISNKSFGKYK